MSYLYTAEFLHSTPRSTQQACKCGSAPTKHPSMTEETSFVHLKQLHPARRCRPFSSIRKCVVHEQQFSVWAHCSAWSYWYVEEKVRGLSPTLMCHWCVKFHTNDSHKKRGSLITLINSKEEWIHQHPSTRHYPAACSLMDTSHRSQVKHEAHRWLTMVNSTVRLRQPHSTYTGKPADKTLPRRVKMSFSHLLHPGNIPEQQLGTTLALQNLRNSAEGWTHPPLPDYFFLHKHEVLLSKKRRRKQC